MSAIHRRALLIKVEEAGEDFIISQQARAPVVDPAVCLASSRLLASAIPARNEDCVSLGIVGKRRGLYLPSWRQVRRTLNDAPLAHTSWAY